MAEISTLEVLNCRALFKLPKNSNRIAVKGNDCRKNKP